jgi:hypothetical protein
MQQVNIYHRRASARVPCPSLWSLHAACRAAQLVLLAPLAGLPETALSCETANRTFSAMSMMLNVQIKSPEPRRCVAGRCGLELSRCWVGLVAARLASPTQNR